MASPAAAFQVAEDAALRASAALAQAMPEHLRILTDVPSGTPLPYVLPGPHEVYLETDPGCADEAEIISTVQWWSRTKPLDKGVQARAMGAAIVEALNAALAVTGWEVVEFACRSETYVTDPDQSTHGRAVFAFQLTEIAA